MLHLTEASGGVDSVLARFVHPYVRLYCALVLCVGAALARSWLQAAAVAGLAVVFAVLSATPLRAWLVGFLSLALLVIWLLAGSAVGGMRLRDADFAAMALFAGRCYSVFLSLAAVVHGVRRTDLVGALDLIRVPSLLTALTAHILRFCEVIEVEARQMNTARILRGGAAKSFLGRARDVCRLAGTLMLRSHLRAERVAAAMDCRGFTGRPVRAALKPVRLAELSPLACVLAALCLVYQVTP